jgi:glycosyltransferase involved in cell wall biosynthesis
MAAEPGTPTFSVIIPVYRGERYVRETIASVAAQTVQDWEIIAVNDGSPDNSLAVLEEEARRDPQRIRVISVQNGGVSRARNTGAANARGEFLAFIDQDDLWAPAKLARQLSQFRADPSLGLSFTNESVIDEHGTVVRKKVLAFDPARCRGRVFAHLVFDNFIPVSSVMIRKDLFAAIGGFDPQYTLAEDYDFLLRAAREATFDFIDEPLLLYREHGGCNTFTKIDTITRESFTILDSWKAKDPAFFRRNAFRYFLFKLKFWFLNLKVQVKKITG